MDIYDLCCLGHITLDKVVTPTDTIYMPGGTSFYFSQAVRHLNDIDFLLVTAVGETEVSIVEELRKKGLNVRLFPSRHSVYFENIYGENKEDRTQRVLAKADPFSIEQLTDIKARVYHLGALLVDDFSLEVIRYLSGKGLVSMDAQGYLREVVGKEVHASDWLEKKQALKYVHTLKVNENELEVLTRCNDIRKGAGLLYDWGVKEVLITLGSKGSVIYDGSEFHKIPAYLPRFVTDSTGCGDTYTLGYLYQRLKGVPIEESGKFAAAMATLKIEKTGPFVGKKEEVMAVIDHSKPVMPDFN
jgi:Sugar kinases, ribokinase family